MIDGKESFIIPNIWKFSFRLSRRVFERSFANSRVKGIKSAHYLNYKSMKKASTLCGLAFSSLKNKDR